MNYLPLTPNILSASITGLIVALSPAVQPNEPDDQPISIIGANIHYRPSNLTSSIKVVERPLLGDPLVDHYRPQTELGRRLIELWRAHILAGGKLLNWDELDEEVRSRRGGMSDA